MRTALRYLLAICLVCLPLFAQQNAGTVAPLHEGLVLEKKGQFDAAVNTVNRVINSGQLSGVELGRAYFVLGFAYHQLGRFGEAQSAFDHALHILEHDAGAREDYATTLNDYAGLYGDAGQLDAAKEMWTKAFHLRQRIGNHAATMRTLLNLADLAVAQKRAHQARKFVDQATREMEAANNLTEDDLALFSETQGWVELAEGHAPAAVAEFQRALDTAERVRGENHWLTGWEHILLGKAYAQSGDLKPAAAEMQTGLDILDRTLGHKNLKYFAAETAYSQVLDRTGSHAEAARLRAEAEQNDKDFYSTACLGCTINLAAFH
jgi:tetratricopeptide (TPR) repeat protein